MKKCPQCNSVFPDELVYCTHDGTPLVSDNLPLPSAENADAEPETVIRAEPFVVAVAPEKISPAPVVYHSAAPPIIVEKAQSSRNYLVFLMIGLLLGGGLVLLTLVLSRSYSANNQLENSNGKRRTINVETGQSNVRDAAKTTVKNGDSFSEKHAGKTNADEDKFNGRVIVANANLRSAPDLAGTAIDALPLGDRINIERRENDNSPWFHVTCEHGASGWMHGNMIEYTE